MAHIMNDLSALLPVPVDVPTGWLCPCCKRVYAPRIEKCAYCSPADVFTGSLPRPKPEVWERSGMFAPPSAGAERPVPPDPYPERRRPEYCWRSWPPRHTETCGCPQPADDAGERPEAEKCRVCGSPEVTYRNFRDLPFCPPCTSAVLALTASRWAPCQPPREGGMCGCDEPDEGEILFVPARAGLTPDQVRSAQDRLNEVLPALAIAKFLVLPSGAKVLGAQDRLTLRLPAYMAADTAVQYVQAAGEWREVFRGLQVRVAAAVEDGPGQYVTLEFRLTPPEGAG